jgi:hypothetical protein
MRRQDLHVLVALTAVQDVLDAEIRKAHGVVEERQIVLACPGLDLARIAIRASVAVRRTAVVLPGGTIDTRA